MSGTQGSLVQTWSKGVVVLVAAILVALHISSIIVAITQAPELMVARAYPGVHCQPQGGIGSYSLGGDECGRPGSLVHTVGEGVCLTRGPGDLVRLKDIRMSFRFPTDGFVEDQLTGWNRRIVASLSVSINMREKDIHQDTKKYINLTQVVKMSASLDYAPLTLLDTSEATPTTPDCIPLASPWHSKAIILQSPRTLDCNLVTSPSPLNQNLDRDLTYLCSLHPLLELTSLSNSSYILQLRLEDKLSPLLNTNSSVTSLLTLVKENDTFHWVSFIFKCFFTPLILVCLVWFLIRLCINDLYISIPDRLLITVGLAQTIDNIPSDVLVTNLPLFSLFSPISHLILITSLALFWLVFTLDKLAKNEPWERTTRYYWKPISCITVSAIIGLLGLLYLNLPPLLNPLNSHWTTFNSSLVSLVFIFGLVVFLAIYQTCLSVVISRVLCDISVSHPVPGPPCWRLKSVLFYCLLISLLVSLTSLLHLSVSLVLHWNSEVHTDPLPFNSSLAGVVYLMELAGTNIHISSLLILLSRSPSGRGWYRPSIPIMYTGREEQLHLWDLSAHSSPLHK